ncbi:MAG: sigma-54-dependent Fis family transcriptional regulator [Spirochaetes bacterium]|nr:sigma-54-dependent Fis family transcriptional regulator [Spirochaetota bacterium]
MDFKVHDDLSLLIIDDEEKNQNLYKKYLINSNICNVFSLKKGIEKLRDNHFDIIIADVNKINGEMDYLSEIISDKKKSIELIILSDYKSMEKTMELFNGIAEDFLIKPFNGETLISIINRTYLKLVHKKEKDNLFNNRPINNFYGLIGQSKRMQYVFNEIVKAAATSANVLITGESGTGKELVARAIHYNSLRSKAPFITVNCAGIPESLLESELFGYVKGAFTGAHSSRIGFFYTAQNGTIFLDEITEITPVIQVKLLRIVQNKEFYMLGSSECQIADVRIITASNKDVMELTKKGFFREDLYYRLNVIPIHLPPLRERREDIKILTEYFSIKYCKELNKNRISFTDDAIQAFELYSWPGNIRELENVIQRIIVMTDKEIITLNDLPLLIQQSKKTVQEYSYIYKSLEQIEMEYIKTVLSYTKGNKTIAAKILDIDRKTLWDKLRKLGQINSN